MRNCERGRAPASCSDLERQLLACYEAAPPDGFACSGEGFQRQARPEEWTCPSERDALIECAYPPVKQCLDVCRSVEASYAADAAVDAASPSGLSCPSYDIPCDSICWLADRYLDASAISVGELADEIMACAVERAERCRHSDASPGDTTWSSALEECAENFLR